MRAFRHIGAWYGGTWLLSYGGRGRPLGALLLSLGGLPLTGGPEFSVVLVSILEIADLRRAPRPLHSAIVKRPLTNAHPTRLNRSLRHFPYRHNHHSNRINCYHIVIRGNKPECYLFVNDYLITRFDRRKLLYSLYQ